MQIEAHEFGFIVIDGKRYTSDLIIYPDGRVTDSWRRKRGHRLSRDDITQLIESKPEVIVVGTVMSGRVEVEKDLEHSLLGRGIALIPAPNTEAIKRYNELAASRRVGACFHLTC